MAEEGQAPEGSVREGEVPDRAEVLARVRVLGPMAVQVEERVQAAACC